MIMNQDTAFSVIVSGLGNMMTMLNDDDSQPMLKQLLVIFNNDVLYDIFLPAVKEIGLNTKREIVAEALNLNMHLCLIVSLFYVMRNGKDNDKVCLNDKIYLRAELELLQEAFSTMGEDEFLKESSKAVNALKDLIKTH
jgi:hypothetical protein